MARPILLFCCHPLTGHITPVLRIAAGLHQQLGWRVSFLSAAFFRARIEAAGLQFLPLVGDVADLDDDSLFDRKKGGVDGLSPEQAAALPQSVTDNRHQALCALPGEWASLQAAVDALIHENPGSRILVVTEAFFYGAMPLKLGLSLPPAVLRRSVCLSITAPAIRSVDHPPYGYPDSLEKTPDRPARLAALWNEWITARAAPLSALWREKLKEAGLSVDERVKNIVFMAGANYVCHDAIAQVGVPSFELPRSDMPAGFHIVGVVPPVVLAAPPPFPWWGELVSNQALPLNDRKKVVVVAQGTVETEPTELIVPTIRLLADRTDVLTIAILGVRGASLSESSGPLPVNCRVADYLSYDAVLPYAALWVHNGGYGATMHGIIHGVPQVLAGETQDKPESGKRVQYSGLGINLATAHPTPEALGAALDAVLSEPKYAATAQAMQAEAAAMDCVGNVEKVILEEIQACT
ncbi:hypothetical protein SPBR_02804 [Sporothrix brasiliensis 5110]|uniref:Erythromycin biosynthesis protein CIII-like C-terminal domain-containing protein n=1 Tax=Sporothrix brasiliensis 5110 TaxID=1398154 RepID=A0A0C2FMX0_9PEZI|nr:uncharacterized protein SPBR_02804 [Sporothrix brasiliensis 5110]KIH92398.1 hypothetical protein SPBR_02804 [Sporothrix brasiliensis 5110]